jgi:hypothetical protein
MTFWWLTTLSGARDRDADGEQAFESGVVDVLGDDSVGAFCVGVIGGVRGALTSRGFRGERETRGGGC